MSAIETNIFQITNLTQLSSRYRTYRVVNLHPDQEEYYQNREHITRKLSYALRSPVVVIEQDGEPLLVVDRDAPALPKNMFLVRTQVAFEPLDLEAVLDYTVRSPENDAICIRFLSFRVQGPLHDNPRLWQPGSGQAFFEREPREIGRDLNLFRGYSVRPVLTSLGEIGLCVDVHSKLLFKSALPVHLDRQSFQRYKGCHCVYHFGNRWYEITLSDFSDFPASQHRFPVDGRSVALYDHILDKCDKPLPEEIARLPKDSAVVMYTDKRGNTMSAAAALCFRVVGTDDRTAQEEFPSLSLRPDQRRTLIHTFVDRYLKRLRFGDGVLTVDSKPINTTPKLFQVPDLSFGHSTVLSMRATPGAVQVSLDDLGPKRLSLLKDKTVGFYEATPLDNFFFLMPQSSFETYGPVFLNALRATVDDLFPHDLAFSPELVVYPDRNCHSYQEICDSLFRTVAGACKRGGFAVAMMTGENPRRIRQEDTSAAYVIQQLRERFDLRASVIHTTVGAKSYVSAQDDTGQTVYSVHPKAQTRLNGYLRNVAINKVLLLNQKWPFVLATPLHADVIVGIDVKGNMAGFIATNKLGTIIVPYHMKSQQKEKLMPKQCREYFSQVVAGVAAQAGHAIKKVVIHRDGRIYQTEIRGLTAGLADLKAQGVVEPDAELTFIEIPQTSPAAFRLFDLSHTDAREPRVQNPQIGNHFTLSASEGYICTTGRAFRHKGTARPLHVVRKAGTMPIEEVLEDVFSLSCLAWTRPEDCTRDPITTMLNDRWLGEDGAERPEDTEADDLAEEVAE